MYSQRRFKKLLNEVSELKDPTIVEITEQVANLNTTSGLTDAQVSWVKNKVAIVEAWKDIAITKFAEIEARLTALETKAAAFQVELTNIKARLKAHNI